MQRGSQIRLNGYGDLKTTARSCYGQHGSHCDPWAVQVEIIQSQSAELAVAVNARIGGLAACGKAYPGQLRWTQSRRSVWLLRINS